MLVWMSSRQTGVPRWAWHYLPHQALSLLHVHASISPYVPARFWAGALGLPLPVPAGWATCLCLGRSVWLQGAPAVPVCG